jgi:hypothetical protein
MAHHPSAKKRIRQTKKRTRINRTRTSRIRTSLKKVETARFSFPAAGTYARSGQGIRPPKHGCTPAFASVCAHKEYVGLTRPFDTQE